MIVRVHIDEFQRGAFDYRVSHEGLDLFGDAGLASLEACLQAAIDGLGADALAAEVAFKGVVSGTYPLDTLAVAGAQIAEHARNTTEAIEEVLRQAGGLRRG
jgi:hypothetical protein